MYFTSASLQIRSGGNVFHSSADISTARDDYLIRRDVVLDEFMFIATRASGEKYEAIRPHSDV